jgi:hypothetical protein
MPLQLLTLLGFGLRLDGIRVPKRAILAGHMDLALDAAIGGFTLLRRGAGCDARQDLADSHGMPSAGLGVQIIVEVELRSEGAVLGLLGSRPDSVKIVLMCTHPHKAGEEFQARRHLFLSFLESSSVWSKSCDGFGVGVRESMLRIRLEQQNE